MEQAKREYEKPFQYEEELKTKLARQFELNNLLDMENREPSVEERSLEGQEPEISHVAEPSYEYGTKREENR